MKILFACVLLAAAVLSSEAAPSQTVQNDFKTLVLLDAKLQKVWTICDTSDITEVHSITILPYPPERGKPLTVTPTFTLSKEVTGGQIELSLILNSVPINFNMNLCDTLVLAGKSCPLEPGTHTLSVEVTIPGILPNGPYTGHIYMWDQNGNKLICINLDFCWGLCKQ